MVLSWHTGLLPRLERLLTAVPGVGKDGVVVLYADKVAPSKRQDWIDREVRKKKRRILVSNPVAIQTGLNNLVWFATQVWMENPACNPVVDRQSIGRIDRIGGQWQPVDVTEQIKPPVAQPLTGFPQGANREIDANPHVIGSRMLEILGKSDGA